MSAANLGRVRVWFSNFLTSVAVSGIERIAPVIQSELVNSWLGNDVFACGIRAVEFTQNVQQ